MRWDLLCSLNKTTSDKGKYSHSSCTRNDSLSLPFKTWSPAVRKEASSPGASWEPVALLVLKIRTCSPLSMGGPEGALGTMSASLFPSHFTEEEASDTAVAGHGWQTCICPTARGISYVYCRQLCLAKYSCCLSSVMHFMVCKIIYLHITSFGPYKGQWLELFLFYRWGNKANREGCWEELAVCIRDRMSCRTRLESSPSDSWFLLLSLPLTASQIVLGISWF